MNYFYCIYRVTNKINGKTYIGQHGYLQGRDPLSTTCGKEKYWGSGVLLEKAYKKYGKDNFYIEILEKEINSKEEINRLEISYINKEKENKGPEFVYNLAKGGTGGDTVSGRKAYHKGNKVVKAFSCPEGFEPGDILKNPRSEEVKQKISASRKNQVWYNNGEISTLATECPEGFTKGYLISPEKEILRAKHISEALKGHKGNCLGLHHFNNGEISIMAKECPTGFVPGRLPSLKNKISATRKEKKIPAPNKGIKMRSEQKVKISKTLKNKKLHWYNNGVCQILSSECPEGFTPGRLK